MSHRKWNNGSNGPHWPVWPVRLIIPFTVRHSASPLSIYFIWVSLSGETYRVVLISTTPPSSPATIASSSSSLAASLAVSSSRPLLLRSVSSSMSTASTIGTIIAVVAVFDIHMDKNIVGSMSPSMSLRKREEKFASRGAALPGLMSNVQPAALGQSSRFCV